MSAVILAADGWDIEIDPAEGAGFVRCEYKGQAIFRPRTSLDVAPFDHGNFVLVPYSNRVEHGRFEYRGRNIQLPLNIEGHPHQLHGTGWQGEWQVTELQSHSLTLTYKHVAGEWPWSFEAQQTWTIEGPTLTCDLSITNTSGDTMPSGLGVHPYFPGATEAILTFKSDRHYLGNELAIPHDFESPRAAVDFSTGKAVAGSNLDDCFSLIGGKASIRWPDRNLKLNISSAPHACHATVYAPSGEDFFCFEPVSNMNNALNWLDREDIMTGIRELAPAETMSETVVFKVSALDDVDS